MNRIFLKRSKKYWWIWLLLLRIILMTFRKIASYYLKKFDRSCRSQLILNRRKNRFFCTNSLQLEEDGVGSSIGCHFLIKRIIFYGKYHLECCLIGKSLIFILNAIFLNVIEKCLKNCKKWWKTDFQPKKKLNMRTFKVLIMWKLHLEKFFYIIELAVTPNY